MSSRLCERVAVVGAIDPQDGHDSTLNTDIVDMKLFRRVMLIAQVGTTDDKTTVKIQSGAEAGGGDMADLKTATELAVDDDNSQVIVEVDEDELPSGDRYVRGVIVTDDTGAASLCSAVILGGDPRHLPAYDNDHADVAEIELDLD